MCVFAAKEVISVNGTFLQLPDVTNSGVKLCVSFGSGTNTDDTVVLVYRMNDCNRLVQLVDKVDSKPCLCVY